MKIPDVKIDHKIAASIMTKGLTALIIFCLKLIKLKLVKQFYFTAAAAGGVGQIFCQWAKSIGCKVIGTVGSDIKLKAQKKWL